MKLGRIFGVHWGMDDEWVITLEFSTKKGMQTNIKNADGLLHQFVPSHLEAVAESMPSNARHTKNQLRTRASTLGDVMLANCCTRVLTTSISIVKIANDRRKAKMSIIEAFSQDARLHWCHDLFIDVNMLTRSVEASLKRKELSW